MSIVHKEERREGYVPMSKEIAERLVNHVNEEVGMFRTIKLVSAVLAALAGVLIWIFVEKNSDIRAMQAVQNEHSVQINRTLTLMESQSDINKLQTTQIERLTEILIKVMK